MPEIFKGICHITLSNTDDNGLHHISIHSPRTRRMKVDKKGKVLTVQREDRHKLKVQKVVLWLGFVLFLFSSLPFPRLFLPLLPPSTSPPFSPQQDAAWTSARCHGNQDWGDSHVTVSPRALIGLTHESKEGGMGGVGG